MTTLIKFVEVITSRRASFCLYCVFVAWREHLQCQFDYNGAFKHMHENENDKQLLLNSLKKAWALEEIIKKKKRKKREKRNSRKRYLSWSEGKVREMEARDWILRNTGCTDCTTWTNRNLAFFLRETRRHWSNHFRPIRALNTGPGPFRTHTHRPHTTNYGRMYNLKKWRRGFECAENV